MSLIKLLELILSVILAFIITQSVLNKTSKDIKEAIGEKPKKFSKRFSKEFGKIRKIKSKIEGNDKVTSLLDERKIKLIQKGNYIKFITPSVYYLIKGFAVILLVFLMLKNISIMSFISPMFLFFLVDIYYALKNKEDNAEIIEDIPKMYRIIEINAYADIETTTSLLDLHEVVKNKRLKNALVELAAEIKIRQNVKEALVKFKGKFQLPEIESFALGIEQSFQTGKKMDFISNQSKLINKRIIRKKDVQNQKIGAKFLLATLFVASGIVSIIIFSFYYQIHDSISKIIF